MQPARLHGSIRRELCFPQWPSGPFRDGRRSGKRPLDAALGTNFPPGRCCWPVACPPPTAVARMESILAIRGVDA